MVHVPGGARRFESATDYSLDGDHFLSFDLLAPMAEKPFVVTGLPNLTPVSLWSSDAGAAARPADGHNAFARPALLADSEPLATTTIFTGVASDVVLNADRTRMYIARDSGIVTTYDTATGQIIADWWVGARLNGMDISPDGSFLLVAEHTATAINGNDKTFVIHKVDLTTGAVTDYQKVFSSIEGPFHDVAIFADGTAITTTTLQGSGATTTYRLNTATGAFSQLVSDSAQGPIVSASGDRLNILLTPGYNVGGPVQMYALAGEGIVQQTASRGTASSGNSVHAFTLDGRFSAYLERLLGGIDIFDINLNKIIRVPNIASDRVAGLAFDDHGDNLYVLQAPNFTEGTKILKVSTVDWTIVDSIPVAVSVSDTGGPRRFGGQFVVGPDAQFFTIIGGFDFHRVDNPNAPVPVQGSGANDALDGDNDQNYLYGLDGDDLLSGAGGNDTLRGGSGNDVLDGGAGRDMMYGGDGDDVYIVDDIHDRAAEPNAAGGRDLVQSSVSFELEGNIENLILVGAATNGTGNAGANIIVGNGAANVLKGMGGDDVLVGGEGNDTLDGGSGRDALVGQGGDDRLIGGADAANEMSGGTGDDTYVVANAGDTIIELDGEGIDTVETALAVYVLSAANVENLVGTSSLRQVLVGNAGNNRITGGLNNDELHGGLGDDTYVVLNRRDTIIEAAGAGSDRVLASVSYTLTAGQEIEILMTTDTAGLAALDLTGNEFGQLIVGNYGANILSGGGGADDLSGLGGNDILLGGDGADFLNGGEGNDVLNGGAGADNFVFADALVPSNIDGIQDFVSEEDRIFLENDVFTGLAVGVLAAGAFVVGTSAQDADDRIIYDPATGALYFDVDGAGGAAAVQFAFLSGAPALTAGDFAVI